MKSTMLQSWYQKEKEYENRITELREHIDLVRRGVSPRKWVPSARMDESEVIDGEISNLQDSHETEMDKLQMRNMQLSTEIQNARAQLQLAEQQRAAAPTGFGSRFQPTAPRQTYNRPRMAGSALPHYAGLRDSDLEALLDGERSKCTKMRRKIKTLSRELLRICAIAQQYVPAFRQKDILTPRSSHSESRSQSESASYGQPGPARRY